MEFSSTSYFKIIPFDYVLDELENKQINIVLTGIRYSNSDRFYDVYVDKTLIDKYGCEKVNEMVKEKINERLDKEMERDLGFLKHIKEDTKCQIWKH